MTDNSTKKNMKKNITFGTDPEFALVNRISGQIESAITVLGRDKNDKIPLAGEANIYYDNVLAEANILPAKSKNDLTKQLRNLYLQSKKILANHKLGAVASHNFSAADCEHQEAKRFGCDPERDVYSGGSNVFPPNGGDVFRSAGGHIHIGGINEFSLADKMPLIVLMDIFVGIPSVILDNDPTSVARKRLYGKAGRFRNTDYGVEYRVLSNFWLSDPKLTEVIYDLSMFAVKNFLDGKTFDIIQSVNLEDVRTAINEGNIELASKIFDSLEIPETIRKTVIKLSSNTHNFDIFSNWKI